MKPQEFNIELLKKFASFLYTQKLGEVINYYHLKNLEKLPQYSQLTLEETSNLIKREIESYLLCIQKGKIIEEIKLWISDLNKNKFAVFYLSKYEYSFALQLLLNRKIVFNQFIREYTKENSIAVPITKELEYLFTFQESLFLKEQVAMQIKEKNILNKNLSKVQKILDYTPIHINIYDIEIDKSIFNNGAGQLLFGHTPEQVMESKFSKLWKSLVHPSDKKKIIKRIKNFSKLKNEDIDHLEYRMLDKNGNIVWYYSRARVFKRVNGKVTQILLNGLNITEFKKAENERLYVTAQLKEAQKIAHIGSFDWDIENDRLLYTQEAYRIYDLPKDKKQFKISDFKSRLKPTDQNKFEVNLKNAFLNNNAMYEGEYRIVLPDKSEKDIISRAKIINNTEGKPIRMRGTVMDITGIKKTEHKLRDKNIEINNINRKLEESKKEIKKINFELEDRIAVRTKELKESEEQYRFLAENVPQLFWTARPDGGLDFQNKNLFKYTGGTPEEINEWNWQNYIHPDDLPIMLKAWKKSLATETTFQTEFRIKRADGMYRWHLVRTVPLKNKKGKLIKWMGSAIDIDEQLKYSEELQKKNALLYRTNQDLDNFIYTASHDLKAPISNIEGLLTSLSDEMDEESRSKGDIQTILEMMERSVLKFKKTIFDLTEITKAQKSGEEETQYNNIEDVLENAKSMMEDLIISTKAKITTDFSECTMINFSKKNFRSILYNLLNNAIKFRSPQRIPEIFIKTKNKDNYIELSVKDNGRGFDSFQKSKVFKMFKRLQSDIEGTGVGLYLVKRIITNAGGYIKVNSKKGIGSEFKVYFKSK